MSSFWAGGRVNWYNQGSISAAGIDVGMNKDRSSLRFLPPGYLMTTYFSPKSHPADIQASRPCNCTYDSHWEMSNEGNVALNVGTFTHKNNSVH